MAIVKFIFVILILIPVAIFMLYLVNSLIDDIPKKKRQSGVSMKNTNKSHKNNRNKKSPKRNRASDSKEKNDRHYSAKTNEPNTSVSGKDSYTSSKNSYNSSRSHVEMKISKPMREDERFRR